MQTEAQKRAKQKYQKEHTTGKYIQFNKRTDADILEYIKSISFQTYVKKLIREDMKYDKGNRKY